MNLFSFGGSILHESIQFWCIKLPCWPIIYIKLVNEVQLKHQQIYKNLPLSGKTGSCILGYLLAI